MECSQLATRVSDLERSTQENAASYAEAQDKIKAMCNELAQADVDVRATPTHPPFVRN